MTISVTGGTGLVGSRLLRRFVDAGLDCRALVRPGKEVPAGAKRVEGDLLDTDSLQQAVEGVSAIVHLAAVFRTPDQDAIWRANLDGTRNLIAAAKAHAPEARFVIASTGLVYDEDASWPGLEDDAAIRSSRIRRAKLPPRTSSEAVDSPGASSVSRLYMATETTTWLQYPGWSRPSSGIRHGHLVWPTCGTSLGAVELALTGVMDGRIVNIVDDAPTTLYEMANIVGASIEPSAEPLTNPWMGRMDGSRSRSLGFRPTISTVYQAAQEGIL